MYEMWLYTRMLASVVGPRLPEDLDRRQPVDYSGAGGGGLSVVNSPR